MPIAPAAHPRRTRSGTGRGTGKDRWISRAFREGAASSGNGRRGSPRLTASAVICRANAKPADGLQCHSECRNRYTGNGNYRLPFGGCCHGTKEDRRTAAGSVSRSQRTGSGPHQRQGHLPRAVGFTRSQRQVSRPPRRVALKRRHHLRHAATNASKADGTTRRHPAATGRSHHRRSLRSLDRSLRKEMLPTLRDTIEHHPRVPDDRPGARTRRRHACGQLQGPRSHQPPRT
jgi:hypothetical protein